MYYSYKSHMWLKGEIASFQTFPVRRGDFTVSSKSTRTSPMAAHASTRQDEDGLQVLCYPVLIKNRPRVMQYKASTDIRPC